MYTKWYSDPHLYVVIVTVAIATLPRLTGYLPQAVTDIAIIVGGAILVGVNMYQNKTNYLAGRQGVEIAAYLPNK